MANQHPSADLLDHYLINDLSVDETVELERHVYACDACFSRVNSRDMEAMAFAKACMMLEKLENDGTRVLTLSIPEPDRVLSAPVTKRWQFQPQYAMAAATVILTAITISSVGSADKNVTPTAVSLVDVPVTVSAHTIEPLAEPVGISAEPATPVRRRRVHPQRPQYIVAARYTRPFLPPDGDVEAPELDMTQVPPPVYAMRRLDAPAALVRLPDAPKKRVRRSRRVFTAIASPFRKIGGAFAVLLAGRERTGI